MFRSFLLEFQADRVGDDAVRDEVDSGFPGSSETVGDGDVDLIKAGILQLRAGIKDWHGLPAGETLDGFRAGDARSIQRHVKSVRAGSDAHRNREAAESPRAVAGIDW